MKALSLRKEKGLVDFDPQTRESENGKYLLFFSKGKLILVIDETNLPEHDDLFTVLLGIKDFKFDYYIGGGRYSKKSFFTRTSEKPWKVDSISHKFGMINDPNLLKVIAVIITNGEEWQ